MNKEKLIIEDMKIWLPHLQKHIQNKKVLDIGCGTGFSAKFLAKECHAKYHLLDYEDLRDSTVRKMPFKLGSITDLPFKDEEFDVAQTFFMLHHLDKKISLEVALREALRVCHKLIIIEEIKNAKTNVKKALTIDKKMNKILHPKSKFRFTKYYSDYELKKTLKKASNKKADYKIKSAKLYAGKKEHGSLDIYLYIISKPQ